MPYQNTPNILAQCLLSSNSSNILCTTTSFTVTHMFKHAIRQPLNPIHLASIHESPIPISTKPSSQSTELTAAIVVYKPLNTNTKQKMVEREPTSDEDMRSTVLAIVDEEIGLRAIWGGVFARVGVRSSLWHLSYALSLSD